MVRFRVLVLMLFLPGCALSNQSAGEFEVASVKPSPPEGRGGIRVMMRGGPGRGDPGRIDYSNVTLKMVLVQAYGVRGDQIQAPDWLSTERFDITAKLNPNTTKEQFSLMLQNLLASRFKMAIHHVPKEYAVYAVGIARSGHKLKESAHGRTGDSPPGVSSGNTQPGPAIHLEAGHLDARRVSVHDLLEATLAGRMDRPVVDLTGLTGVFDLTLDWLPVEVQQDTGVSDNSAGIVSALQRQLGLTLQGRTIPMDTIIVDHAERIPTAN